MNQKLQKKKAPQNILGDNNASNLSCSWFMYQLINLILFAAKG